MLVSPTVGPRTMLCCVGMLLLFSACLLREAPYLYLLGAGAILAWHWGQAWAAVVVMAAAVLWQVLSGTGCLCGGMLYSVAVLRLDYAERPA